MSARLNAAWLRRFWVDETPAGLVNGTNTLYVVSQTPLENESMSLQTQSIKHSDKQSLTVTSVAELVE